MAVVKVTHPAVGVRGGDRAPSGERIRTHAAGFKKPQTQMLSAQEPPAKGMPPPGLAGTCGPGPTDGSGTRPAGTVRGWPRPPHPGFSLSCWPSRAGILPAGWSQAGPSWGLFLPTRALFTLKHVGSHRPASLQRPGPARPPRRRRGPSHTWRSPTPPPPFLEAHSPVLQAAKGRNYPFICSDNYSHPSDTAFVLGEGAWRTLPGVVAVPHAEAAPPVCREPGTSVEDRRAGGCCREVAKAPCSAVGVGRAPGEGLPRVAGGALAPGSTPCGPSAGHQLWETGETGCLELPASPAVTAISLAHSLSLSSPNLDLGEEAGFFFASDPSFVSLKRTGSVISKVASTTET